MRASKFEEKEFPFEIYRIGRKRVLSEKKAKKVGE